LKLIVPDQRITEQFAQSMKALLPSPNHSVESGSTSTEMSPREHDLMMLGWIALKVVS
jgi:hypothetical protein